MSIPIKQLIQYLDQLLNVNEISDYCPNGLQVEGKADINKIVTGVTASEALIDAAIEQQADVLLVHHGFFWKGENPCILGMKRNRIQKLLANNINLVAYHLPLDVHPELGNNAQLAKLLGITHVERVEGVKPKGVVMKGELSSPTSAETLVADIKQRLNRAPLASSVRQQPISTLAWCTGGGQSYIDIAADINVDAFITGEASEQTIHVSRERQIDFFAAGHHATERYGVKALGQHLIQQFGLKVEFIDIDNPV